MRVGARGWERERPSRLATPSRRSAIANSITPPSEVRRPPSKAAVTFLARMAGNENGRGFSLVMASGALAGGDQDRCSNQILRYISALHYARQPKIAPVMNKMG